MDKKTDYDSIYTLNTRQNIFYDLIEDGDFKKSIWYAKEELKKLFLQQTSEDIYKQISKTLMPNTDKKEIALLFKSNDGFYGKDIFNLLFKIISELKINTNILAGDILSEDVKNKIISTNSFEVTTSEDIFVIYLNNLSVTQFNNLIKKIKEHNLYLGYKDMTYSNNFKTYLSLILCWTCIFYNNKIICHEESFVKNDNEEKFKFILINDENSYLTAFLHYKIEQGAMTYLDDLEKSLKILYPPINLKNIKILSNNEKLKYIRTQHNHGLNKLNIHMQNNEYIINYLNEHFKKQYAFNFQICQKYGTLKFNTIYEENNKKSIVSFKIENGNLSIITMY